MNRPVVRWFGLAGIQALVIVLLLEGALRLARPLHPALRALLYTPAAEHGYEDARSLEELMRDTALGFVPHAQWKGFVLNSRSFRTREYPVARAPEAYRIVALGDSFTVGAGRYSRSWPAVLEKDLARRLRRPVEVFALGVPGVGPRFALRLWELERELLGPDLVVLGFFVGNDFTDDQEETLDAPPMARVFRVSFVARFTRNLLRAWDHRGPARDAPPAPPAAASGGFEVETDDLELLTFTPDEHLSIEAGRLRICLRKNLTWLRALSAEVAETIGRLDAAVRATGAELLVLLIPDEFQVNETLLRAAAARLRSPLQAIDLDQPQRLLGDRLEVAGIRHLDLLPAFRAAGRTTPLYFERNTHWNDAGNALAAELLGRELEGALSSGRDR